MYSIGKNIRLHLFGKSHAPCVGCILEGLPEGIKVSEKRIAEEMELRRPKQGIGTPRKESDAVKIISGISKGKTDGLPIMLMIMNENTDGSKYLEFAIRPRPGHADLPALMKWKDHDIRGGGQFSGRLTAPLVAAGAILKQFTETNGIMISAFSRSISSVNDKENRTAVDSLNSRKYGTRACTAELDNSMRNQIIEASNEGDSVGGVVECVIEGLPIGFGGIWFDALDAEIAKAIFGIPAVKGIEFGKGFELAGMRGSESNDQYRYINGIKLQSNNMGGILGGMSDGMPVVFRTIFKPTPSISKEQNTIDLEQLKNATVSIRGRHDPCIVPRAVPVVEAMTSLVVADRMITEMRE